MTSRFACFKCLQPSTRSNITIATMSEESCMHSLRMVKMVLIPLWSSSMIGRKSICVLCFASSAWIIFIQSFQLNVGTQDHQSRCPKCVAWSEEWLVMSQRGGELSDGDKRGGVYSCLFPVYKWKNLYFGSSHDLCFIEYLHLLGTSTVICAFGKGGAGEWKGVFPWIETTFKSILSPTICFFCFVYKTSIGTIWSLLDCSLSLAGITDRFSSATLRKRYL